MESSNAFAKILIGHRRLISLQQKEIERLRNDLQDIEEATTQVFPKKLNLEKLMEGEIASLRQEIRQLQASQAASRDTSEPAAELATLEHRIEKLEQKQRKKLAAIRHQLQNMEELQADTLSQYKLPDTDSRVALKEIRQSISSLKTEKASSTELLKLSTTVENLKNVGHYSFPLIQRYNRLWTLLFLVAVAATIIGLIGPERSWALIRGPHQRLSTSALMMSAGLLASVLALLNILLGNTWKMLSWKARQKMSFFRQVSGARLISVGAVFIIILSQLARLSL